MLLPAARERTELLEVVRITGRMNYPYSQGMVGDSVALWDDDHVRQVLALIADVPGSELHRCFIPGWGIRARSPTDLLFEIAFCFRCHGVRLWGPSVPAGQQGIHGFDPGSPPALELLRRFRACAPGGGGNGRRQ
ncbi:hypothetical protein [Streptacidiphilus sp. MAP12-16]|uniref:hypothetical protein n=1 Tax=Streptacidiphilus sp. MAP12-16 TaxID=3156300 RepID=UPI0035123ECC